MYSAYRVYEPGPALMPFVRRYWEYDSSIVPVPFSGLRKVVPDAGAGLIINMENFSWINYAGTWEETPTALIQGIISKPYLLQSHGRTRAFGILFKTEGLLEIFGLPQQAWVNRHVDAGDLLGPRMNEFIRSIQNAESFQARVQIAESYLLSYLQQPKKQLPYLRQAFHHIRQSNGLLDVEALCDRVFVSRRQLERQFSTYFGLNPKMFIRIERFRHARELALNAPANWTRIACDCGYADQAHLIREFRELSGESPNRFLAQSHLIARI